MQRNKYINMQGCIPQRIEKQKDTSAIIVKHNQPTEKIQESKLIIEKH